MSEPHNGDSGSSRDGERPDAGSEDVGNVGEEAAKLLGALAEWAKDSGGGVGSGLTAGLGGLAGHAAATVGEVNAHLDTGAAECTYCPVCRTVHVIRTTSPEIKAHLVTAASSLLQAAAGLLATLPAASSPGAPDLERIDLDDDEEHS